MMAKSLIFCSTNSCPKTPKPQNPKTPDIYIFVLDNLEIMVLHRISSIASWTKTRLCFLNSPSLNLDSAISVAMISSIDVISSWLSCSAVEIDLFRLSLAFRSNLRY